MEKSGRILGWLVGKWEWPYATVFTACFLTILAPFWFHFAGMIFGCIYIQLPMYMFHQCEEHAGDRFRIFFNRLLAGGQEALTPIATFWINSWLVWGVDLLGLYLAVFVDPAFGLMTIYLPLLNSIGHLVSAIRLRKYNPGLYTGLFLFMPLGGWSLYVVSKAPNANWMAHAIGIAVAVAVHVSIMVHVFGRVKLLKKAAAR